MEFQEYCVLIAQGIVAASGCECGVLWLDECCGLWPQRAMISSSREILSVASINDYEIYERSLSAVYYLSLPGRRRNDTQN